MSSVVMPESKVANVDISSRNCASVSGEVENRAFSYIDKKLGPTSGGFTRPKDARCVRYSRRPMFEGLCSNATPRASGIVPLLLLSSPISSP